MGPRSLGGIAPTHLAPARARAFDGGQVQFDGMYYDFRAANGIQHIKMWVPPGPAPIRGAFFNGNPGDTGDSRTIARDKRFQGFAARFRFAVAGVTTFPSLHVYSRLAEVIVRCMDDWAALGFHPEIANLPLVPRGGSNGGVTAYSLSAFVPERVICFTSNVGARYIPSVPPPAMLRVPALTHIGPQDPFFPPTGGVQPTAELFARVRPKGALWAWDAEKGKGHEDGHCADMDMKFYEQIIPLRLPADADASKGPVRLNDLPEDGGWLADPASWQSGITYIASYKDYGRDRAGAVWLPTADMAFLYRAVATHDNPLKLSIRRLPENGDPGEPGPLLGTAVEPGTEVLLECDADAIPDWQTIAFYQGAKEIGRVEKGQPTRLAFRVEPHYAVYALTAITRAADGTERAAAPGHFLVTDPQVGRAIADQWAAHDAVPPKRRRSAFGSSAGKSAPAGRAEGEHVLVACGLTPEHEHSFTREGGVSAFWDALGARADRLVMTPADSLASPTGGVPVKGARPSTPPASLRVEARAAHSRAGLYFLFLVDDPEWAPPRDLDDIVDLHLARMSSNQIWAADPCVIFAKPESWGFLLCEMQYQVYMGCDEEPARTINRNFCDPWDVATVTDDYAAAVQKYGIVVKHVALAPARKALELFIPWRWVGNGGDWREPPVGTRLSMALGYNDHDPSRHVARQADKLRWCDRLDVWWVPGVPGANSFSPSPWGDLEIGPIGLLG